MATRRVDREGEPRIRSFFSRCFYKLMNIFTDVEIVEGARDFRLMTRAMTDAVLSLSERNRFTKGIYGWVGFKTFWLPYENVERIAGKTKWNFWGLFKYAIDGIIAFSVLPLTFISIIGILTCVLAITFAIFVVIRAAVFGDPVAGWPSLMTVILLVSGVQILFAGIIGQYLSRTYLETKHRPLYLLRAEGESESCTGGPSEWQSESYAESPSERQSESCTGGPSERQSESCTESPTEKAEGQSGASEKTK